MCQVLIEAIEEHHIKDMVPASRVHKIFCRDKHISK